RDRRGSWKRGLTGGGGGVKTLQVARPRHPPADGARQVKTRRVVRRRSDATHSAPGDKAEVTSLLWARARGGSVTACMLLLREFNRSEGRKRPCSGGLAIDELAKRRPQ